MARIRTIKPSFFRHKELYDLVAETGLPLRVAFAGLWTVADRAGRFRWRPEELKLDCLPFDPVSFVEVLDALERGAFVRRYESDGKTYGVIPSFAEHQVINQREPASVLPDPTGASTCAHGSARGEGKGREGKGIGTEECAETLSRSAPSPVEPSRGLFEARAVETSAPPVLLFPVTGKTGPEWRLTRAAVEDLAEVYPGVDIVAEARKALGWVRAAQTRRKTARGMLPFLTSWIGRSVNRGEAVLLASPPADPDVPDWYDECQRLHGGTCGGRTRHATQRLLDGRKAPAKASRASA